MPALAGQGTIWIAAALEASRVKLICAEPRRTAPILQT